MAKTFKTFTYTILPKLDDRVMMPQVTAFYADQNSLDFARPCRLWQRWSRRCWLFR